MTDVGDGASVFERIDALEREAATLRERIERARAASGEDTRAYGRRISEENDALRRENAELSQQLQTEKAKRRDRVRVAGAGWHIVVAWVESIFRRE